MLSNAYFVAKFRFDTAENEPAKNLQNFQKMHFSKMHFCKPLPLGHAAGDVPAPYEEHHVPLGLGLAKLGKLAKFCKFLAGSFSAVSKRNFARKYAFDSIFQALQDLHISALLQSQNFSKKLVSKISNSCGNSDLNSAKYRVHLTI